MLHILVLVLALALALAFILFASFSAFTFIHFKVEEDEPSDRIVSVFLCNYSLTFICECGECDGKSNCHDKYDKQTSERTNE